MRVLTLPAIPALLHWRLVIQTLLLGSYIRKSAWSTGRVNTGLTTRMCEARDFVFWPIRALNIKNSTCCFLSCLTYRSILIRKWLRHVRWLLYSLSREHWGECITQGGPIWRLCRLSREPRGESMTQAGPTWRVCSPSREPCGQWSLMQQKMLWWRSQIQRVIICCCM